LGQSDFLPLFRIDIIRTAAIAHRELEPQGEMADELVRAICDAYRATAKTR
jgi:hypothetical protein